MGITSIMRLRNSNPLFESFLRLSFNYSEQTNVVSRINLNLNLVKLEFCSVTMSLSQDVLKQIIQLKARSTLYRYCGEKAGDASQSCSS